ncbi:MAG TPA: NUDIX hydrolase [Flavilitoribacter sp.]|nr:NUDIX hydrolase [Flavilitoribacter sp.]HMQ88260.1 NUDIX hydrolase [Flavilitoribacter sp.]
MPDFKNPWQTVSIERIYDNPWIAVSHRDVINPSGNKGIYGVVHFKNLAIGIVPLDEQGNTWLVGQYRYTIDQYSWEIPEGGCPLGTDPLASAQRELLEETGITAGKWEKILDFHTSNSVTDEAGMVFLARELSFGPSQPEETEKLEVRKLPFSEAVKMVESGEITDALSVMALLRAQQIL